MCLFTLCVIDSEFYVLLQLESAEDIHMVVHPGTYAVTAGEWGTKRQQTHVVHVEPGQSVNLDFVM